MSMIFMKLSNVSGSVTEKNHKNWIDIDKYHFGMSRTVNMRVGKAGEMESSVPVFGELEIIKSADKSSINLFDTFVSGKAIDECQIDLCHTGDGSNVHASYILNNVMVTHMEDVSSDHDGASKEYIRFSYTKLQRKFIPYDKSSKAGSPLVTGYSLETGEQM